MRPKTLIKAVVTDIDGCITPGEVKPIDFSAFRLFKKYNQQSKTKEYIPAITICSGRQQPYVEAILQMVDGYLPGIYESGSGLYFPDEYKFLTNPNITQATRRKLRKLKQIFEKELVQKTIAKLQPGKEVSFSLYPCGRVSTKSLYARIKKILAENALNFEAVDAVSCINVLVRGIDKAAGIQWFSTATGISLDNIAGVGDTVGDIPLLKAAGFSAAPANAVNSVKSVAEYVSPYKDAKGIIDILKYCRRNNLQQLKRI